jgi:hypothetical protein
LPLIRATVNHLRRENAPDPLKEYVALRDEILAEREQLIVRLREMDEALGAMGLRGRISYYGRKTPTGRARNETSLKDAVLKVIERKSMTKHEILDSVIASGYQFSTDDPMNSFGRYPVWEEAEV